MNASTRDRSERGFTLIELMVVVVILAILAAVIIPVFTSQSKKVKAKTEVSAMFAELASKQERYKGENNVYLATAECPTPASNNLKPVTACMNTGDPWVVLGVVPPQQQLRCSYEITVGTSADTPAVPSGATAFTIPTGCCATSWYIVHARCDMDGNGTLSHYVTASFDATLRVTNEGQ
jgi:prepilin-type N-terminal cleavage/methylation domain-containing protein